MAKRQPKPEPFTIAELEEIAQSPALQGFEKVLQYRPVLVQSLTSTVEESETSTVEDRLPSTVDADVSSTVEVNPTSTVLSSSSSSSGSLWTAEGAGGVFTSSRIKRIVQAQDAMTHVEEAVYDALWGPKKSSSEPYRRAQMGYSELAKRSRVSKRSIQSVIDRLIEKQFIAVDTPADITCRKPTVYRVLSYSSILKFLRETNRNYVIRTGRGVFYARTLSAVDPQDSTSTVEDRAPSTVEARSTSTVEASSPSTVEATSTVNTLGNSEGITSSSVTAVASAIVKHMAIDDDAVRQLIQNCRRADPMATENEIAYSAELWIHQNARNTSIRKPVAVMLTAVPKFFEPPATELSRYRQEKSTKTDQSRELALAVLANAESSEQERKWAQALLQKPDA